MIEEHETVGRNGYIMEAAIENINVFHLELAVRPRFGRFLWEAIQLVGLVSLIERQLTQELQSVFHCDRRMDEL